MNNDNLEIEKVINSNTKLIYKIVRKFQVFPGSINWDDCVQAGRLAVVESLLKYNANKRTKLSTFMYIVIKNKVLSEIMGGRKNSCRYDNQHNKLVQYHSKREKPVFIPLTESIDNDGISSYSSILTLNNKNLANNDTPLTNLNLMEEEDMYDKVSQCLTNKYGEKIKDMILAAFDSNNFVKDNYQFIYQNYHLLKPFMSQRAKPIEKMSYHQKHIWNFRLVLGRLAQKALKEDELLSKLFKNKTYVDRDNMLLYAERKKNKCKIQQLQNNKVIAEYPTIVRASRTTGVNGSRISKAIKYKSVLSGFEWRRISNE